MGAGIGLRAREPRPALFSPGPLLLLPLLLFSAFSSEKRPKCLAQHEVS